MVSCLQLVEVVMLCNTVHIKQQTISKMFLIFHTTSLLKLFSELLRLFSEVVVFHCTLGGTTSVCFLLLYSVFQYSHLCKFNWFTLYRSLMLVALLLILESNKQINQIVRKLKENETFVD